MNFPLSSACIHASIFLFSFLHTGSHAIGQALNCPSLIAQRTLGSNGADEFRGMQLTQDGGCMLAGYATAANGDVTMNLGQKDFWTVKLNSALNIEWQRVLGGSGDDWARDVQSTADGGYVVCGYSNSTDGDVQDNQRGYFTMAEINGWVTRG
jgi:hypothetical protein